MSEQRDPARWMDSDELTSDIRRELELYAADAPSIESRARMFAGLERELAFVPEPAGQAVPATQLVGTAVTTTKLKLVFGALGLLASALGLLALWSIAQPVDPAKERPRTTHAASRAPAATEELSLVPSAPAPQLDEAAPGPAPLRELVQERGPSKRLRRSAGRATKGVLATKVVPPVSDELFESDSPSRSNTNTRSDPVAELALLAQARRALLSQPAHALEFTELHARDYPHGTFGEEREVLAIESLCRLGLTDEAKRRAAAFERHFPNSAQRAHLTRMMQALGP